ncbi:hypothetical protein TCAL_11484 [Tigriopus californicus]|uniref:Cuticle protein n=1 Tax=Tigriopus californicus TaxID=6832 RepID=A0A553P2M7_TIGCA|nr:cuticle protein-like [Tigriopus californicus]TRY71934.1 hypothetical protein TCAL_11484 [Tigriopus californicus]|eukprot:TCALIF_11484-PA protein Name:"Similar to resilin Pro-resilin (Drosophila melanogaster)" AED:0.04 eAED:0.04 QI:81/1/0.5/1/0/0.5/2/0/294
MKAFIATSLLLCASSAVTGQFYANEPSFFRPSYRGARQNEQYPASPAQPTPDPVQPAPRAYPQPQPQYDEPASYAFEWQVQDDYTKNDYGHKENRENTITNGEYFVLLPDGRTQKVTYTVDGYNGYQAEVSYEGEAQYPADAPQRPAYPRPEYRTAASEPKPTYQKSAPTRSYPQPTAAPSPAYPQRSPAPAPASAPAPAPAYSQRTSAPSSAPAPAPSSYQPRYPQSQPQPSIRRYSYKPAPVEKEETVEQDQSPAESQDAEAQNEYQTEEPQVAVEQPTEKPQTYETYYKYF